MGERASRFDTIAAGLVAGASVAVFWAAFAGLLSAPPGVRVRVGTPLPALAFLFGHACWVGCLAAGVRQLFARPRWYGLATVGIGVLQFLAVPLALWLVMRARGIEWGS